MIVMSDNKKLIFYNWLSVFSILGILLAIITRFYLLKQTTNYESVVGIKIYITFDVICILLILINLLFRIKNHRLRFIFTKITNLIIIFNVPFGIITGLYGKLVTRRIEHKLMVTEWEENKIKEYNSDEKSSSDVKNNSKKYIIIIISIIGSVVLNLITFYSNFFSDLDILIYIIAIFLSIIFMISIVVGYYCIWRKNRKFDKIVTIIYWSSIIIFLSYIWNFLIFKFLLV